jgi:hypothetical protein
MYICEIVFYTKLRLEKVEQNSAVHNYNMHQGLNLSFAEKVSLRIV